ncbi:ABC transporter ATP-binding protein [Thermodesulfatator atlanticus]
MDPLLEAGPFSFVCQGKILYQNVKIALFAGDFVHLKGPSGCGKTTLLRQIIGLERADGAVRKINGKIFRAKEISLFRGKCIYLAPEAPLLEGKISENLFFPYQFKVNRKKRPQEAAAKNLLATLGLPQNLDQDVKNFSTGERQRLALVRALLFTPQVILADEPFSGLDAQSFEKAFQALYEFSRLGTRAVICVSHQELPKKTRTWTLTEEGLKEES